MAEQSIMQLLQNYTIGEPFSNKHGVRCHPATDNRTGLRSILKIHKIPRTSVVTDAFIFSGAFKTQNEIRAYYRDLAQELCRQVAIINALSQSAYFSHFTFCETVECEDGGYEVWLIAPYQTTLAALFKKLSLSRDEIVRLGISLCRALAICRQAGYMYTGVKPENIYISESGQFVVGDVGFISLSSLPYATLPIRHQSVYTPKESHDCQCRISDTSDIYSVGVVLYQAACNGMLPEQFSESNLSMQKDIKDVIMTACQPSQDKRWKTPEEMESALLACLNTPSAQS